MAIPRYILCLSILALIVSCALVIIGIIGLSAAPNILQNQIYKQLPLSPDSNQVDTWSTPPVPVYMQFWLWECVNPIEVGQGAKPEIFQHGPYTYLEHRKKTEIYFNENNTVTYRQPISYTFLRDMSVGDENEAITMINVPIVTVISLIRNRSNITQEIFNFIKVFFNEPLFVTHTVREWIWGYEDPLLKAAKAVLPNLVSYDRFGYFDGKNGSDDGLYTVYTGADNIDQLNTVDKWNGLPNVSYWKTPYANQINGTDGSWFHPLVNKDLQTEDLYLFSTDLCRSLYAKFVAHSSVLNIPTEIFSIPSEVFANTTDNAAFGINGAGVLNVSTCRQGAPIFISSPHFLYADQEYANSVRGIAPDENHHRTILEVEPHTGLVLNAQKRLQINVYVKPDEFIDDLKHVSEVLLPAIWVNESTTIDQKSADDLNNKVLRYFTIIRSVSIVLIPLGVIFFIITIIFLKKRRVQDTSSPLLFAESPNSATTDNNNER